MGGSGGSPSGRWVADQNAAPIPAGEKYGHAHQWCSKECFDADCEFGPCCVLEKPARWVEPDCSKRGIYSPEPTRLAELRDFVQGLTWQEIVLAICALLAFVALCFAPQAGCSVSVDSHSTESSQP